MGCYMKKMVFMLLLMFVCGIANAVKIDELNGMWLIESYQEINGGKEVNADGTDFWEFNNSEYNAYSSGFKFTETKFVLNEDTVTVKKDTGDQVIKIESFVDGAMRVNDGKYFYNLRKQ